MIRGWNIILVTALCLTCAMRARAEGEAIANEAGTTSIAVQREPTAEQPVELPASERLPLGKKSLPALNIDSPAEKVRAGFQNGEGTWGQVKEVAKVGGALALVIGLIFLTKKAVGGKGLLGGAMTRPSGVLEILARYPLGKGQQLIVLKMARRVLLVSQGPNGASTLAEFTDRDEVANLISRMEAGATGNSIKRFRNILQGFSGEPSSAQDGMREEFARDGETMVVDLTRSQGGGLTRLFHRRGG